MSITSPEKSGAPEIYGADALHEGQVALESLATTAGTVFNMLWSRAQHVGSSDPEEALRRQQTLALDGTVREELLLISLGGGRLSIIASPDAESNRKVWFIGRETQLSESIHERLVVRRGASRPTMTRTEPFRMTYELFKKPSGRPIEYSTRIQEFCIEGLTRNLEESLNENDESQLVVVRTAGRDAAGAV